MRFKINKRARLSASMLASGAFIALAIWGWGLSIGTALSFLVICLLSLALLVGLAAALGWLLHRLRNRDSNEET